MDRVEKKAEVELLKSFVDASSIAIITRNKGLTVIDANKLRARIKKSGSTYRVTKNRLAKIAFKGTKCEALNDNLTGPTAIAFSHDPVAVAKALSDFAKENEKLEIVGGIMDGAYMSPAQVKHLASLPSLDELRGKIIGLIQAPATKVAGVIAAPASQLARVIAAYSNKE